MKGTEMGGAGKSMLHITFWKCTLRDLLLCCLYHLCIWLTKLIFTLICLAGTMQQ